MSLNFSHGDAQWSCSGFNNFREKLMRGLGETMTLYNLYEHDEYFKHVWGDDDIFPLINHCDCEGELTIPEMIKIIPRVAEIILLWNEEDYDRVNGMKFVEGMKLAIGAKESLKFV